MAFKMKPSTYLKTKPNTRSMGMFKQTSTDPPLEANRVDGLGRIVSANSAAAEMTGIVSNDNTTTEVGYTSGRDRQFDETGASIEAGAEWYTDGGAENVSYDTLSPQQQEAIEVYRNSPDHKIEDNIYSKDGKLYFDQGTFLSEFPRMVEPLLIDTFDNTSDSSDAAPENVVEEEDEEVNFTESISGFTSGGSKNQHTFSSTNPYLPSDGSKKFEDKRRLTLARKWERKNNTDKKRSASNRFGGTFEE